MAQINMWIWSNAPYIYRTYHRSLMAVYNSFSSIWMWKSDHNTGNYVPYSCEQCVGSLTSHKVIMNKGCETGPTIYRPYTRRLDSLTICRYYYKGSTISSVIFKKTLSVGPAGVWTRDRCSTNWANRSAKIHIFNVILFICYLKQLFSNTIKWEKFGQNK